MPTVDFGSCLSVYWFAWTINGAGTVLAVVVNMVITYFFLKFFHSIQNSSPSPPANPQSNFSNVASIPPVNDMYTGSWVNDPTMGNAFNVSTV